VPSAPGDRTWPRAACRRRRAAAAAPGTGRGGGPGSRGEPSRPAAVARQRHDRAQELPVSALLAAATQREIEPQSRQPALLGVERGERGVERVEAGTLGIGTAAYNSSSNILFITLSLLLTCLILSGVLSWYNLRGVRWRLQLAPPLRAGHDAVVALELRNRKRFLPTYGLWFEFAARPVEPAGEQRAESTVTARGA
jgi:hypothetical protein